jgi:hypothetical protein
VTATSRDFNLSVSGSVNVTHNNPWGRAEIRVQLPYGGAQTVSLFGRIRREDIRPVDAPPKGIDWQITEEPSFFALKLSATGAYKAETTLTLLDTASGEKVRIFISPTGEWDGVEKSEDPTELCLFGLSVILTVGLSVYLWKKIGGRSLLPPLSPYRH